MANTKIPVELSSTPGIVDNSNATAITIDSSERVNIGKTSATTGHPVEIQANTAGQGMGIYGRSSDDFSFLGFYENGANTELSSLRSNSSYLGINIGGSERMRIDSSGHVGINTSSPDAPLHVFGENANATDLATSASNAKVRFRNHSGSSLTSNEGYTGNSWYKQISNGGGTTAYDISLNPFGGKVSVGTDDPSAFLQVHGGSVDYDPSSTGTGLFHVTAGASSNYTGYIGISDSGMSLGHNGGGSRYLRFDTNETERMRIDSSGDVGIGTSTINSATLGPNNKFLEVAAGTASGSGTLVLSRNSSTNDVELGGIRFVNANNADDDGLDADGKMVAAISARSITSDSNAGDDSGADLTFSTKPEAGSFVERFRIFSLSRPSYSFGTTSTSTTEGPAMYAASTTPSANTHLWFHFLEAKNNASAAGIKVGGLLASSSYAIADPIRGAIYAQGDVSAQTFTDRTPYPTSLQLAKDVINSHQRRSEEEITRVATEQYNKIQEKSDMPQPEREALSLEEFLANHKKEYELDHSVLHDYVSDTKYAENGIEGRDASATISCLVEVVKDLMKRIETLEGS